MALFLLFTWGACKGTNTQIPTLFTMLLDCPSYPASIFSVFFHQLCLITPSKGVSRFWNEKDRSNLHLMHWSALEATPSFVVSSFPNTLKTLSFVRPSTNLYLCLSSLADLQELMKQQRDEQGMTLLETASRLLPVPQQILLPLGLFTFTFQHEKRSLIS